MAQTPGPDHLITLLSSRSEWHSKAGLSHWCEWWSLTGQQPLCATQFLPAGRALPDAHCHLQHTLVSTVPDQSRTADGLVGTLPHPRGEPDQRVEERGSKEGDSTPSRALMLPEISWTQILHSCSEGWMDGQAEGLKGPQALVAKVWSARLPSFGCSAGQRVPPSLDTTSTPTSVA